VRCTTELSQYCTMSQYRVVQAGTGEAASGLPGLASRSLVVSRLCPHLPYSRKLDSLQPQGLEVGVVCTSSPTPMRLKQRDDVSISGPYASREVERRRTESDGSPTVTLLSIWVMPHPRLA
jgi:hypothetical protein